MKTKEDRILEWSGKYYHEVYTYVRKVCKEKSLTEEITNRTFMEAYDNVGNVQRAGDPKGWMYRTARYFILKEFYEGWKRGEDISAKYELPENVDMDKIQFILKHYEEENGKNK